MARGNKDLKHKAYERLKELHAEADSATYGWSSSGKFTEWMQNVRSALRRLYGNKCDQLKAVDAVHFSPLMFTSGTPDHVFHESFLSGIKTAQAIIGSAIREYEDYESTGESSEDLGGLPMPSVAAIDNSRRIFVVHGHDNEMKQIVARFLERLGFEPVILHERPSGGATVIEKFERHSDVSYAVVLLSPDDVGASKNEPVNLQPRARQNVVLELGYFIGRLGRAGVFPLVKGPLEIPSDIHGVVYVPYEGEDWKLRLVKELKHFGFEVDANKAI